MKRNACEMSHLATGSLLGVLVWIFKAFVQLKLIQQAATVKRFDGGCGKPPYAKRDLL